MMGHAARAHSLVSPSQCERFWACPGSVRLIYANEDRISRGSSKYAEEGTRAHEYAEFCIRNGVDPMRYANDYAPFGQAAETYIPLEMAEAVTVYLNTIIADLEQYNMNLTNVVVEARLELNFDTDESAPLLDDVEPEVLNRLLPEGSCDAYFVAPDGRVYVYDLKYGKGYVVSAEKNKQMMYYAAGVYENCVGPKEFVLRIVQPRADTSEVEVVDVVAASELKQFRKDLCVKIVECASRSSKFCEGAHCKFCPVKTMCPEKNEEFHAVAASMFTPVVVEQAVPTPNGMLFEVPNFKDFTPAGVADYLEKIEKFQNLLDSLHTEAYNVACDMAANGNDIPGYKYETKKSNRKWVDENAVLQALNAVGVDAVEYKLKSPAQVEKQLKQLEVEFDIDAHTVRETKDPVLVRTEKLEPVNLTMFKPVNQ